MMMRATKLRRAAGLAAFVLLAACKPQAETQAEKQLAPPPAEFANVPPYAAQITLQDLMNQIIDPEADVIWNATGSVATKKGIVERAPKTDEDWEAQRRAVVRLLEASNLLLIPDRKVADKPFESAGPGVYSSAEIQQEIDTRRAAFNGLAMNLRGAAQQLLKATDTRDVQSLLALGDVLDQACEGCHKTYWYPNEKVPYPPLKPPSP
ncbi:cytochrome c [Oxalobacteraceae bacterium A2-2]